MRTRRQFFRLSLVTLVAVAAERALRRRPAEPLSASPPTPPAIAPAAGQSPSVAQVAALAWLPLAQGAAQPTAPAPGIAPAQDPGQVYLSIVRNNFNADDPPLLGPPFGTAQQAADWLAPRAAGYASREIADIVAAYADLGGPARVDWFLALAQLAHETGSLTSWWSQPPRRNPAGIGVTGRVQPGALDTPPGPGWTWDGAQWREGLSFVTWPDDAIPAHLGRLLAYALTDQQANDIQRGLVARALSYRPLPASYRGIAPTIGGLNGRWAVPGTNYGQNIAALAWRMRDGV
jgi:hypothetical protein